MRSCEWIRICERMKIGVKNMEAAAERMGRITMIDGKDNTCGRNEW